VTLPRLLLSLSLSDKRMEPAMRRVPSVGRDFVDFVTVMLAAMSFVLWLFMALNSP